MTGAGFKALVKGKAVGELLRLGLRGRSTRSVCELIEFGLRSYW